MSTSINWREPGFASAPVGGKARALGSLSRAGFAVPPWIVVLPAGTNSGSHDLLGSFLAAHEGPFAVRSSAIDEDGHGHSFAGQFDSFLNVPADLILQKIEGVRASAQSERVLAYRQQAGLPPESPVPAVIVQVMVPADAAGVAFSSDPVSGRRGVAVVAAVGGLGEGLVSGEDTGHSFRVDREGVVIERPASPGPSPVTDDDVRRIAALAARAAETFGVPQDIEWALASRQLFILQSRPITSLAGHPDPDGQWQLWDNSNIAESYTGITTPLTFSFAREIYREVYLQFVRLLRVPTRRIEANRDVFGRMLGLISGRVYYNLCSWYRVLAMLPGFALNRKFMEEMMGVKEGLPPEALPLVTDAGRRGGLRDFVDVVATLAALAANHALLRHKISAFQARLDQALAPVPLPTLRPDELAAHYRQLQRDLLTRWDAPLINDFFAMIYFGISRKLAKSWCGDDDGTLQNDLITCQGGIISAEPARRIMQLAALARSNPALLEMLNNPATIPPDLAAFPDFHPGFLGYLEQFGDRCLEELKLESETLHDDPAMLLRSIAALAMQPAAPAFDAEAAKAAAEKRVRNALTRSPWRAAIFGFVMARTRHRVRDRENLRFERTRVFGRVRRIFLELGNRLRAEGILSDPRHIFFLETEEALGFVEGTTTTTRLAELVRLRMAEYQGYTADVPDDRFETRGMVNSGNAFRSKSRPQGKPADGVLRKGVGCCPGVVRGRARVILHPRDASIENGEILVAPRTDPGWILLFPSAHGLLVEHGSLLSHSAIVAREMGIPAVVAIEGLTSWLRTGDLVELDGSTGRVVLIEPQGNDTA